MKSLVAGGAGFIGSHLIDALLEQGCQVVCIDNFFIGTKNNIKHLEGDSNFTFYECDICSFDMLNAIFAKEKPDYVFHLAANSDIKASASAPMIECSNTYQTTFNLLECMRLNNVKRLFFASTSAVYGEKTEEKLNEITADLRPVSYYGGAKLGSEAIISAYTYMNEMSTLIFRFPNVIGPRLTHGVIFDFVRKLKADPTRLEILGDGTQCKPYIYVSDLIDVIVRFMNAPKGVTLYNIGVDSATTVTHIAEIICEKMKLTDVKFEYTGGNIGWRGDVPRFSYDLTKVHNAGWTATHTSDEAVALTVERVLS